MLSLPSAFQESQCMDEFLLTLYTNHVFFLSWPVTLVQKKLLSSLPKKKRPLTKCSDQSDSFMSRMIFACCYFVCENHYPRRQTVNRRSVYIVPKYKVAPCR